MTQEQAAWCNRFKEMLEPRYPLEPRWTQGIFYQTIFGDLVPAQDVLDLFQEKTPPDR